MEGYFAVIGVILAVLMIPPIERLHMLHEGQAIEKILDFGEFLRRRGVKEGYSIYLSDRPLDVAKLTSERAAYKKWEKLLESQRSDVYNKFRLEKAASFWIYLAGQVLILLIALTSAKAMSATQYALVSAYGSLSLVGAGIVSLVWIYLKVGTIRGALSQRRVSDYSFHATFPVSSKPRSSSVSRRAEARDIPTGSPTSIPKVATDKSSGLRAKGMKSYYPNWKRLYLQMGRPAGQSVETEVELIPDLNNRFDSNAVSVVCNGFVLGYIPIELAQSFRALIATSGGVVRADAELWFDFKNREKRNSVRLLIAEPYRIAGS